MSSELNQAQSHLPMFIVDVLRHDIEPLSSIVNMLNDAGCIGWREFWRRDFNEEEVISALRDLCRRGWVKVLVYSPAKGVCVDAPLDTDFTPNPSQFWFKLTKEGEGAWEKWEPPKQA